jgi:hypothetical protein
VFGDNRDIYLELFEQYLQDKTLEEYLEEEDITPEECLYLLFINGLIKEPNYG